MESDFDSRRSLNVEGLSLPRPSADQQAYDKLPGTTTSPLDRSWVRLFFIVGWLVPLPPEAFVPPPPSPCVCPLAVASLGISPLLQDCRQSTARGSCLRQPFSFKRFLSSVQYTPAHVKAAPPIERRPMILSGNGWELRGKI